MLEVNCETDFVTKNDSLLALTQAAAQLAAQHKPADLEALGALPYTQDGFGPTLEDVRKGLIGKIGENMSFRRFKLFNAGSALTSYLHGTRIGVVVEYDGDEGAARDVAMHVAAMKPVSLTSSEVPAELIERERSVATAKAAESGKPAEIAAKMKTTRPNIGVDILLEDAEDVGRTEWGELSYCLGTQYWVKNPHLPGYRAMFGILLDMVGAKGARFPLEAQSQQYAGSIQREIWETARSAGYSDYFVSERGSAITDDHIVINTDAHIPCVDIINLKPDGSFADHWHTHQDDMNIIDKGTLKAVGQTVMAVIYNQ
jgi:hypothetical protein